MIVGRPRIATVDIGVPGVAVKDTVAFVACARAGTLMHRNGRWIDVFLFDLIEVVEGGVLGRVCGGCGVDDVECGLATLASGRARLGGGGHGGMEGGELAHHALVLVLFIGMDCLSVLT